MNINECGYKERKMYLESKTNTSQEPMGHGGREQEN